MVFSNVSRNLFLVSLLLIVAMMVFAIVYAFSSHISEDLRENAYKTMNDTSSQYAAVLQARFDDQYIMLDALSGHLANEIGDGANDAEIIDTMDNLVKTSDFSQIYIADTVGNAYANDRSSTFVGKNKFFKKALSGEKVLAKTEGEQSGFIQAVPIERDGQIIAVLYGCFAGENISELLNSEVYDGQIQLAIYDVSGQPIISSDKQVEMWNDSFDGVIFDDGMTADMIADDLQQPQSNSISLYFNGEYYYVTYSALGINDWSIFCIVPATVVSSANGFINKNAIILVLQLLVITALLVLAIILYDRSRERLLLAEKERLRQSEESYELVSCLSDSVLFVGDYATDEIRFNHSCQDILGFDYLCTKISDCIKSNPKVYFEDMDLFIKMGGKFINGAAETEAEFRVVDDNGNIYWQRTEFLTVFNNEGHPQRLIGKVTNINDEKRELTQLQQQAESDSLTKIYNRAAMKIKVDKFLLNEGRDGVHALFMLDIDNFKLLNDTYGHFEGDRVLVLIANKLRKLFRASDIICRMGGDEFAVLLKNVSDESIIISKAEELLQNITAFRTNDNTETIISCSIGISIYCLDGRNFEQLYQKSDEALYEAKARGKNTYELYSSLFPTFETVIGGSE